MTCGCITETLTLIDGGTREALSEVCPEHRRGDEL